MLELAFGIPFLLAFLLMPMAVAKKRTRELYAWRRDEEWTV